MSKRPGDWREPLYDVEDDAAGPSKSELKRQSHELQALGEALIGLPQDELDALGLPEKLLDAITLARRITAHGGLYRQKQYIGKLMRTIDAAPVRAALDARRRSQHSAAMAFRRVESWRARLLEGDAATIDALVAECPAVDRSAVAALVSEARRERDLGRPPRAFRELFALLKDTIGNTG